MTRKDPRTYADITKEIQSLQQLAQEKLKEEISSVVAKINDAIAFYGIQPGDLTFPGKRGPEPRKRPVAAKKRSGNSKSLEAKYRDGDGRSWSGRGPRPRWLREALEQGKKLEDFAA